MYFCAATSLCCAPRSSGDLLGLLQEGQRLVLEALSYLEQPGSGVSRLGFLYNPADTSQVPGSIATTMLAALQLPSRRGKIASFLREWQEQTMASGMPLFAARHACLPAFMIGPRLHNLSSSPPAYTRCDL